MIHYWYNLLSQFLFNLFFFFFDLISQMRIIVLIIIKNTRLRSFRALTNFFWYRKAYFSWKWYTVSFWHDLTLWFTIQLWCLLIKWGILNSLWYFRSLALNYLFGLNTLGRSLFAVSLNVLLYFLLFIKV